MNDGVLGAPDSLRQAFLFVYRDLCARGMGEYDEDIVELLWGDFLADKLVA